MFFKSFCLCCFIEGLRAVGLVILVANRPLFMSLVKLWSNVPFGEFTHNFSAPLRGYAVLVTVLAIRLGVFYHSGPGSSQRPLRFLASSRGRRCSLGKLPRFAPCGGFPLVGRVATRDTANCVRSGNRFAPVLRTGNGLCFSELHFYFVIQFRFVILRNHRI